MAIEIRVPSDEQWPELARADARGFGTQYSDEQMAERRPLIDLERFRVAMDGGRIVGVVGSFAFDMTVPGGATVPMGGTTWVAVSATHRRQGVLTALLDAVHRDIDDRGEPVAALFASEGGIYGRFGYGVATFGRTVVIDRNAARLRPGLVPDASAVRYADHDEAEALLPPLWDRARRLRAGQTDRSAAWHRFTGTGGRRPAGEQSPAFYLVHADGYAVYRVEHHWGPIPGHRLHVTEFVAATPQAHLDLWHVLLGVGLVAAIESRVVPVDDPLGQLVTNPRAVQTSSLEDALWVNVRDVGVLMGARAYGSDDRLVLEVEGQRWAIEAQGSQAECRRVRTRPDLVIDRAALGSLSLGGVRPSELAAGRRAEARSPEVLRRADALFVVAPAPFCGTFF